MSRCAHALTALAALAAPTTAGELVLHINFDDGPGSSVAADVSGNGHHGTLLGAPASDDWVAGVAGLALGLDGVDDWVSVADAPQLDIGTGGFSVSLWVMKRAAGGGFDNLYAVSKWHTGASPGINEWALGVGKGSTAQADDPQFTVEIGPNMHQSVSPLTIQLNTWVHLVGVREGQRLLLYQDGALASELALPSGASVNATGTSLAIGVNQVPAPLFFTDAVFDDLQIYDFPLTAAEVGTLFANPGTALSLPFVPRSYCSAGSSASGCAATIAVSGTPSATAPSGFSVLASAVEGAKDGLFFYGANGRQANAWGNGTSFQCVVPPVIRGGLLSGTGTPAACDGQFAQDLNARWCPSCPKPSQNPGAGAVVQAQLWYRDPFNTSNQTTSLSDAIEFCVGP